MRWAEVKQVGDKPVARSSHTLTAVVDQLYIFGGEHNPRHPLSPDLYRFDLQQQRWDMLTASGQAPPARVGHTAAAVGSRIYVFGGRVGSPVADRDVGDLHAYDTRAGSWASLEAAGDPPGARSYHAAAEFNDSVYIFGGCSAGGRLNTLHRYDVRQNRWECMPPNPGTAVRPPVYTLGLCYRGSVWHRSPVQRSCPERWLSASEHAGTCARALGPAPCLVLRVLHQGASPRATKAPCLCLAQCRGGAGLVGLGNKLYVAGGFNGQELGDVHALDVATRTWQEPISTEQMPPRSVFGIGMHAECGDAACAEPGIFVFGGEAYPTDLGHEGAGTYTNEVLRFSAASGWKRLAAEGAAPSPRGWLAAACMPACMVVHGGNSPSNERLGDMHMLRFHH